MARKKAAKASKPAANHLSKGKKLEPTKALTVNTSRYDPYKSYKF
jgi:hypothetical protein